MIKKDQILRFQNLYLNEKLSLRKIAKIERVSPNTVKKYLLLNKVKVKEQKRIHQIISKEKTLLGTYLGLWAGDGTHYMDGSNYVTKLCCNKLSKNTNKFIQQVILELFGKETVVENEKNTNRAQIRIHSKFLYSFPKKYLDYGENKSLTVQLKRNYSKAFLKGFLLGLMVSDGHLKKNKFNFNTISQGLSKDMMKILDFYSLSPRMYVHNRKKLGWNDLHMIRLRKADSVQAELLLDEILGELNHSQTFREVKYYSGPAEI